jgi:peptidoglycan/xylan/chitin deacetylase (PgdA/CDA1 family)
VAAARSHVPVLCFHQVRDQAGGDSASARVIITPPRRLAAQLDALARAGYTTITPDQLLAYLRYGTGLPPRPVLLSFDDASEGQYTRALPMLLRHRFTATFFVMTVVLDKPRWLSRAEVRDLHRHGMTIAAHTWDHHPVPDYAGQDWQVQLVEPARELARLTGEPVRMFAYPYGLWSQAALSHVRAAGYEAAFQLGRPQDARQPLLTIRRIIASSDWDGPTLLRHIRTDF